MRYFSVEEANRLVPLLTRTFEQVRPWVSRTQAIAHELESLGDKHDALTELLREEHMELVRKLREALGPLLEMGLAIKSLDGLVDFRARLGERPVYLCWRLGEAEVAWWHELESGFAGRRPIENPSEFAPTYLS